MANTLNLGTDGNWATKKDSLLAYNSENNNFKPLPFDFTRASSATVVNKAGLIEKVGSGEPRIDFLGNTKGALLLEPQSTNLIPYSEDFSNDAWAKQSVTITSNSVISPDGSLNADKITDDSTNGAHRITDTITTSSSGSFTYSIFLKKGTLTTAQFQVFNSGTASSANVDLVNGTITSDGTGVDHKIENYGNDWFKCSISGTLSNITTTVYLYIKQKPAYIGDGDYLYAWGAQLEESSYATSLINTQGSTVTRLFDTIPTYLDVTPLNIGNSYTLFLDADLNVNDNNKVFGAIFNSSDVISFSIRNNVGGIRLYNHIDSIYPLSGITSSTNKFVIRVDGNSYKVFVQGSSFSGTLTTQRDLGSLNFTGQNTQLKINNFTIDDTALSDAECQALVN